jgi:holo-[acyl-carrier protein] synthase
MIIKHGIDVVNIDRIERLYNKFSTSFLNKIYTQLEIQNSTINNKIIINKLASRFAAKEAFAKALGTGIGFISFKDIEVLNNNLNAPYINITPKLLKYLDTLNMYNINCALSLSHDSNIALASIIIYLTEK